MPQRRITMLSIQSIGLILLALIFYLFAGLRTVTFFACTGWFTCGDRFLPSMSNQLAILEWLHHWSIILLVGLLPVLFIVALVVYRRDDEAVMAGIRNTAGFIFIQAAAALFTSIVTIISQGPALHFLTGALLVGTAIAIVGWAMFSPNQDYSPPIFLGALVVLSLAPLVSYMSAFV
jgi:hypothetical protein